MVRFSNEFIEFWLEGDILYAKFKNKKLTLAAAKEMVHARHKLTEGKDYFALIDYSAGITADKDVRDYLAGPEGVYGIKAGAIIVTNQFQKILANVFLNFSKPKVPARIFSDREKALAWLKESFH
jgi:hypothetical protein